MNEGGSRKTILLFFFLFLHMEVTGEERRGEERRRRCDMCVKAGERTADRRRTGGVRVAGARGKR